MLVKEDRKTIDIQKLKYYCNKFTIYNHSYSMFKIFRNLPALCKEYILYYLEPVKYIACICDYKYYTCSSTKIL